MNMKHYKDPNGNEIYAYEADGSQDDWIKPGLVPATDEEVEQILKAKMDALNANVPFVDPVEKLRSFLASNPDVQQLLNGG